MDALLLLIQAVLIFGVAFIYSNLGLGGGLLFVPILLSTGVPNKDLAVPISLTLTIATATSSVINHHRRGLVDFRLGGVLLAGALLGAVVKTVPTTAPRSAPARRTPPSRKSTSPRRWWLITDEVAVAIVSVREIGTARSLSGTPVDRRIGTNRSPPPSPRFE